jgi:uncharacterized repeat protein (TIGR01451 family)
MTIRDQIILKKSMKILLSKAKIYKHVPMKSFTTMFVTLMIFGSLMVLTGSAMAESTTAPWIYEDNWLNYTIADEPVRDYEDKPYENDPTHGIANVQPKAVDIASGVDASGGGPDNNPGNYTSVQWYYLDPLDNSNSFTNLDDDWLFLRMRVAEDPTHGGKYYYKAYHWDILIDTDGDIWKEFVVDLNGGGGGYKFGTVGVYYNDNETYEYEPDKDAVWKREASKDSNDYTRAVPISYGMTYTATTQYWIEYKIPVTAFKDKDGNQLLGEDTGFRLFFSTSASMTNPLQKDWMAEYVFYAPPNMTVEKSVVEKYVDPSDIIHYTIYFNNTGMGSAGTTWINDTLSKYVTYHSSSIPYNYSSGNVYTWVLESADVGNHSFLLNVTVNKYLLSGTEINNYVHLDYLDITGKQLPGSEDSVKSIVKAPSFTLKKSVKETKAYPGDDIHYTIEFANTALGCAAEVWVTDTIPNGTTFKDSTPDDYSISGNEITWHYTNVCPGTFLLYLTVTAADDLDDGKILKNDVELLFTDANNNQYPKLYASAVTTIIKPHITVDKSANQQTADPGDIIEYTITYTNDGLGTASNVWIEETVPTYTTYVSASPAYDSYSGGVITWHFTNVAPGTYYITLKLKVDVGTPDGTIIKNNVKLNYQAGPDIDYPQEADSEEVTVTAPIMTIEKTTDVSTADPHDIITYTITYKNTGTGNAGDVWIKDTIPADTTFVSAVLNYTSVSGDTYTWYFTGVKTGTYTITLKVQVDRGVADGTKLVNDVTLDYTDANGNPYTQESDSVTVTVTAPIMTISKIADVSTADPHDIITYTITYKNTGTGNAGDVWIKDTIPADTSVIFSLPTYTSVSGDAHTWHFTDVKPGTYSIKLKVKVDAGTSDETKLVNDVTLDYTDANGNPYTQESDSVTVIVTAPIMTVEKVADVSTADPYDIITYTITYKNTGTGNAGNVWIKDTIPADTTLVSASAINYSVSGDTYTWHFTDVKPGTYTITLKVKVDAGTADETKLVNDVTLDYTDTNGNSYTQESDSVTVVVTAPIITITKTADVSNVDPGDTITYTITYKNTGTGYSGDVWIIDTIPADTTFVSATPTYTSVSGDTYTWHFTNVKPGTYTIILKVRVDNDTPDATELVNKVTMDYTDTNGNKYPQESDSVTVIVTAPIMTITKEANVNNADPGDIVKYTITYKNTGTGNAGHVWINDTIPSDTTYVSSSPTYTSVSGDTYTWHYTDLKPGTYTIFLEVRVDIATPDTTTLKNEVTLDYTDANGHNYPQMSDYAEVSVTAPIMSITKTADLTTANPSDVITYTIIYKNTGTGNAGHVWINDTIPTYTTFVSAVSNYTSVWKLYYYPESTSKRLHCG